MTRQEIIDSNMRRRALAEYFARTAKGYLENEWMDEKYRESESALFSNMARSEYAMIQAVPPPETGVELIAAERQRQIEVEGFTLEHDDEYANKTQSPLPYSKRNEFYDNGTHGQHLMLAAIAYLNETIDDVTEYGHGEWWPFDEAMWKPGTPLRNLVKAGALIAAEIDRIQRAEEKQKCAQNSKP